MKKIFPPLFFILLLGILGIFFTPPSTASESILFPHPKGTYYIPRGYGPNATHSQKELDFIRISGNTKKLDYNCFSYGVPILAARGGTISDVKNLNNRWKTGSGSWGTVVTVNHGDNTFGVYAHMIYESPDTYVSIGDTVEAGQIIGLMGDTGDVSSISARNVCPESKAWGTHLHFALYKDSTSKSLRKPYLPEPLGKSENIDITTGNIESTTIAYDKDGKYLLNHQGKYDYKLYETEIHSVTPLQVTGGTTTTFSLRGNNFKEDNSLKLNDSLCTSQQYTYVSKRKAEISCSVTTQPGLKVGIFPAPGQPEGKIEYQVEVQTGTPSNMVVVNKAKYIPTSAGDYMDIDVTGKNFTGELLFDIYDTRFARNQRARCQQADEYYLLGPGHIKLRCKLPLNLGPVSQSNNRTFSFEVYRNQGAKNAGEAPLYTNNFEMNYGISINELTPKSALYHTPTRFTVTGKNVHRITTFFMEGCADKDWKMIESSPEKLVIECKKIQPLTNESLDGKDFRHLFIFKTRSKKNPDGSMLSDEEDRENIVISGYIELSNNPNTEVHSITPQEAIVGTSTDFTITGINLPFTDASDTQPLVWLEDCTELTINPNSYTTYGFDFSCVPQFTDEQQSQYLTIEKQYEIDENDAAIRTQKKKAVWPLFNDFFDNLPPKKVHVKQLVDGVKKVFPEQNVKFISALYQIIRDEESFQFEYSYERGNFTGFGEPNITRVVAGGINRNNRHQKITVTGTNLPAELQLQTDDCHQVARSYGSSNRFEFMCLLKKVSVEELKFIDGSSNTQLDLKTIKVQEVYDVKVKTLESKKYEISITGVNLSTQEMNLRVEGCGGLVFIGEQSTSELIMHCESNSWFFHPKTLDISIKNENDTFNFFEGIVEIEKPLKTSQGLDANMLKANVIGSLQNPNSNQSSEKPIVTSQNGEFILDARILKLVCGQDITEDMYLGECDFYSQLLREAKGIVAINTKERIALLEGNFDSRLTKAVDNITASKLGGLKINPASGRGMAMVDVPEQAFMMNGDFEAIGIDASQPLGFPFEYNLFDFSGEFIAVYPSFNVNKSREKSKLMFGMGNINHPSITILKAERAKLKEDIEKYISKLNADIHTKKIELGAKLMGKISDYELRKLARVSYIKILKELELVPERIAFYDNFDFEASGKLKSEPFRPKNWPKDGEWVAEANIAELDLDFVAKEGALTINGRALNELTIFNNDFIKAENGLLQAGLAINLKKDNGRVDLNPLTVRLPFDIATVEADAYASHLFKPSQLGVMGRLKGNIQIKGVELADAGAAFQLDPNITYRVGDYESLGVLRIDGKLYLVGLEFAGGTVFTMPGQELAMDLGGKVKLTFLGYEKELGKVLSRARISNGIDVCANADSGTITLSYPTFFGMEEVKLRGGLSIETSVEIKDTIIGVIPQPTSIALSGETEGFSRTGIKVKAGNFIIPFPSLENFNQKCEDAPNDDFFQTSLVAHNDLPAPTQVAQTPQQKPAPVLLAGIDDSLMGEAIVLQQEYQNPQTNQLAQASSSTELPTPTWDMTGWIIFAVEDLNGNEIEIRKNGQPFDLSRDPYGVAGMWFSSNPDEYVIYDQEVFNQAGFEIVLNQITSEGSDFFIATYTNDKETASEFNLPQLKFKDNILEFQNIVQDREISIGTEIFTATETKTKRLTRDDLAVESEVSSSEDYDDLKKDLNTPNNLNVPNTLNFSDLSENHPHYEAIKRLYEMGVIKGYEDGTFRPDQTVNRAEFAKMILEAFGYPLIDKKTPSFKDSQPSDWHYPYIETAKYQGMIKGYKSRMVKPGQTIIKAEGLKILLEAAKLNISTNTSTPFLDVPQSEWYAPYVTTALENGLNLGTSRFEPAHELTRGEVADLIVQVL